MELSPVFIQRIKSCNMLVRVPAEQQAFYIGNLANLAVPPEILSVVEHVMSIPGEMLNADTKRAITHLLTTSGLHLSKTFTYAKASDGLIIQMSELRPSPVQLSERDQAALDDWNNIRYQPHTEVPFGRDDRLADCDLHCNDGSIRAEKSVLIRASEHFREFFRTNPTATQVDMRQYSMLFVSNMYERMFLCLSCGKTMEQTAPVVTLRYDCLRYGQLPPAFRKTPEDIFPLELRTEFAHRYQLTSLINDIRMFILVAVPTEEYFRLDQKYNLGLRRLLLQNVKVHFLNNQCVMDGLTTSGQANLVKQVVSFTDSSIYGELMPLLKDSPKEMQTSFNESMSAALTRTVTLTSNQLDRLKRSNLGDGPEDPSKRRRPDSEERQDDGTEDEVDE